MKTSYVAVAVALVVILFGGSAFFLLQPPAPERTFYLVAYHWGFAVFDENGVELDQIEVAQGTKITLYAINHHAHDALHELSTAVHETLENVDFHGRSMVEGIVPEPVDGTLHDKIEEAEEEGLLDHGLLLAEFGVNVVLDAHTTEPVKVVFTADKTGEYDFSCTVYCGYGHDYMVNKLIVT